MIEDSFLIPFDLYYLVTYILALSMKIKIEMIEFS